MNLIGLFQDLPIKEVPKTSDVRDLYVWIIMALIAIVCYLIWEKAQDRKRCEKKLEEKEAFIEKEYANLIKLMTDINQFMGRVVFSLDKSTEISRNMQTIIERVENTVIEIFDRIRNK